MKFSKQQKETIKLIASREIYDIQSYLQHFEYGKTIKYDKQTVENSFIQKHKTRTFYRAKNIKATKNSILSEEEYKLSIEENKISPSEYNECQLNLNYDYGIQTILWHEEEFTFDFYKGVYVANCFEDILEFLILWEYLKSQMLVLEVNNKKQKENIGLLFSTIKKNDFPVEKQKNIIDYSTLTISDSFFINDSLYKFSDDNLYICEKFLNKRIIPSVSLDLFVKNKFKSPEELIQIKSLWAAWIAIFVSVLLSISAYFSEKSNKTESEIYIDLCNDVAEIKDTTSDIFNEQKNIHNKIEKHVSSDEITKKDVKNNINQQQ